MNITGDSSSIIAIFLVARNKTRLERREEGPYNKLSLSISFLLSSYSGSYIIVYAIKASTATPKNVGRIIFAMLTAYLLL